MKIVFIITLVLGLAITFCEHPLNKELLEQVKQNASWESYEMDENPFRNYSEEEIQQLFGTILVENYPENDNRMPVKNDELPVNFDGREHWPDCNQIVKDQQHCGSCYAFGTTTSLSHRFCVASEGKLKPNLSPEDVLACCSANYKCYGGSLSNTWSFFQYTGSLEDECLPYVSGDGITIPWCPEKCVDGSELKRYQAIKRKTANFRDPNSLKQDLFTYGYVSTGFIVYEDFMTYKSGIYKYTTGKKLGGHAVSIVGWGNEDGQDYWIAQNSWGDSWGENGFFRIAFLQCDFEVMSFVGYANLEEFTSYKLPKILWE